MFDYLSIELPIIAATALRNCEYLSFNFNLNEQGVIQTTKTGQIEYKATLKNIIISIFQKDEQVTKVYFKGSLHLYAQENSNYSIFTQSDFQATIRHLNAKLGIDLLQGLIHGFEFGFNLCLNDIKTRELQNLILCHKGNKLELDTFGNKGYLLRAEYTQYRLKIYDKGLQYSLNNQILRCELKVLKMQFVISKGVNITTMQELFNGTFNECLTELLCYQIEQLIFATINRPVVFNFRTRRQLDKYMQWQNANYWEGLNSKIYNKEFKRYKKILANLNLDPSLKLTTKIKYEHLKTKRGINYTNIDGNIKPLSKNKQCITCGKDISMQKIGSKFCSEKTNGKKAKQCRNKQSNLKHNNKRYRQRIEQQTNLQLSLFPLFVHY